MPLDIRWDHTVLLLVDTQNDLAHPDGKLGPRTADARQRFSKATARIRSVLGAVRGASRVRAVHVGTAYRKGHVSANLHAPPVAAMKAADALLQGSPGVEFLDAIAPDPNERILYKRRVSCFASTGLARALRTGGVDTLLLAGFSTHLTVESTARDAADRGYRVITLRDCCASLDDDRHRASIDVLGLFGEVASSTDIEALLHDDSGAGPRPTKGPILLASDARVLTVFRNFDADGNDLIDREEFRRLCDKLGAKFDDERLASAFDAIDLDGSGGLDFDEFVRWWRQAGFAK
jgi:biuret amidohydrolase